MKNSPDLTGQNVTAHRPHPAPDNMNDSSQEQFKPSQDFQPKTATPLTEAVDKCEENSLPEPKSNPDLTPGQTSAPDQASLTPDQKKNSSWDRLKTKHKTEITEESSFESNKRETSTKKPKQTLLIEPMNKSEENTSQDHRSNPDLTPGWTSAPDRAAVTHHPKSKSNQGIPKTKSKPKPIIPKSQSSETGASPKQNHKTLTHFGFKSEENPSLKSKNHPDLTPGQKVTPDRDNTTLQYRNNSSQEDHRLKHKPETNKEDKFETAAKSGKHILPELKPNPHLTLGQESVPDPVTKNPDQKNKSSEDRPKDKHTPETIQELKSYKSETATTKPSTELEDMSEEKSRQDYTPDPGLRPGQRSTPDQAPTSPDQMRKSSEDQNKDKHKPEHIQELKSNKSESATLKHFPDSVDQSGDLQDPTLYLDLTPGQTSKPNKATATPDQMNKSNKQQLKTQTSQESKFKTATQKPSTESWDKFPERSLQGPTSNPGLPAGQTSTIVLAKATTYQVIKSSQDPLNPKRNPEKTDELKSTPKPNQKHLARSEDKSEENDLKQTKLPLDLEHGQSSTPDQGTTSPDLVNTFNNEYVNTQASKTFKFDKSETASQRTSTESWDKSEEASLQGPTPNPGLTYGHRSTLDLATATPSQMEKFPKSNIQTGPSRETKFNKSETARPKPLTELSGKSEEASLEEQTFNPGLEPGETSRSDLVTATPEQIKKSIQDHHEAKYHPETIKGFKSNKSETATPKPYQSPSSESKSKEQEHRNSSHSTSPPDQGMTPPNVRSKTSHNVTKFNKPPKTGQELKQKQKNPKAGPSLKIRPNANLKTNQTQQTNPRLKTPKPGSRPNLKPISVPGKIPKATYNKTSKLRPPFRHRPSTRPTVKPGFKPIQRSKQAVESEPSPQTKTDPPQISWGPSGNIHNSRSDMPPTSGLVKQTAEVSHTPGETEFSTSVRKTITLRPKTSNSLETGYFPALHTPPEDVTSSPNTRVTSDLRPQTAGPPSSDPMTTRPNKINHGILQNVITSTGPGSTQPSVSKAETLHEEDSPPASPVPSPSLETTSTLSPDFRPKTSSTSGHEPPPAELSTPSPRELRVKINQVTAFVNNSLIPNRGPGELPKEQPEGSKRGGGPEKTDGKLPTSAAFTALRDCSDHSLRGRTRSGVYLVTPDLRSSSFPVFCDMELEGGGWTVLQRRLDGSVSFNRTWVEYQAGFGVIDGGEFWLGNSKMHLLTRDRDMMLRVELEDFDGVTEHAQYEHFRVASERLRYRLTVGGYSGTAGDALRFSRTYDHNNRAFTTPDRDHDRYPSGNCGAYYSSGWWFDACMAANLNGRYYVGKYKGVRDGIFWGTWHNISTEYYPTNERQSFKSVRMMIRPKSFGSR
ncbi:mucin-5AC [Fundulus heteroclitus]|uniref:mucin-5AC n=1 Tax=Fundulus heteroclitus TaxID=8078 RepID=UPI00165B4418|nr:mucin-5AC [Fundulus heteroclitus]